MELSRKQLKEMMPGFYIPPIPRDKSKGRELNVHTALCKYLALKKVMFISDFAAGIKLSKGMATRQKMQKSDHAWPDIFVAEPRGNFHGLFIELKRDRESLYNKDGSFKSSDHIADQCFCLAELSSRGYKAVFACGFDEAKNILDEYLGM